MQDRSLGVSHVALFSSALLALLLTTGWGALAARRAQLASRGPKSFDKPDLAAGDFMAAFTFGQGLFLASLVPCDGVVATPSRVMIKA